MMARALVLNGTIDALPRIGTSKSRVVALTGELAGMSDQQKDIAIRELRREVSALRRLFHDHANEPHRAVVKLRREHRPEFITEGGERLTIGEARKMREGLVLSAPDITGVYFLGSESLTKIGWSINIRSRFGMIQGVTPFPIRMHAAIATSTTAEARELEAEAHRQFAHARAYGEWFTVSPSDLYAFVSARNGFCNPVEGLFR